MASKNQFTSSSTVPKSSMLSRALLETTTEVIGLKNCGSLRRHKSWDFCRLRFCGTSDSSTSLHRVHTNQPTYSALKVRRKIAIYVGEYLTTKCFTWLKVMKHYSKNTTDYRGSLEYAGYTDLIQ